MDQQTGGTVAEAASTSATDAVVAPKDPRAADRRMQILRAAMRVFARQGFHGSRIDDVVVEAGLSKGAIYWYYKSKEQIAVALVEYMLAMGASAPETSEGEPLAEQIDGRIRQFTALLVAEPELAPLALELLTLAQRITDIRSLFQDYHDRLAEEIAQILQQAITTGELQATLDSKAAARTLLSLVDGIVMHWVLYAERQDLGHIMHRSIHQVLDGWRSTPAGRPRKRPRT